MFLTDPDEIIEAWPGFGPEEDDEGVLKPNKLLTNRRVHFAEDAIYLDIKKEVTDLEGNVTKQIRISEPTAKDFLATDRVKGNVEKSLVLLGAISNLKPSEAAKLKGIDFTTANEIVAGFLGDGQQITGTSEES